jgi:N-alpha-acetyltransferase 15/16, NatA auxiliary subunit
VNELKDIPAKVSEVLKSSFTLIPANADLNAYNSEWQQKHSQSVPHLLSAYNVRHILDKSTQGQNEADVKQLLKVDSITIEQADAGLKLLEEWKSDEKTRDAYREAAAAKFYEATVFQKR